jgi:hypothetical protein
VILHQRAGGGSANPSAAIAISLAFEVTQVIVTANV